MSAPDFDRYQPAQHPLPPGMRVLGEGHIGGKALGLFLAACLRHGFGRDLAGPFTPYLRIPETAVLRSSLYEDFLERNALAAVVRRAVPAHDVDTLRRAFAAATFAEEARAAFRDLLADFADAPLAVRSSSLLEDSLNESFAGIYQTRFIPNTGPPEERLRAFEDAVRQVYGGTFAPAAVAYRARRGLRWQDERMSVVVQRMVGRPRGRWFFPVVSGVAFSRNYYPWSARLRPEDGVVRLVYGLGTQAVGRGYARVLSPAWPALRPEGQVVPAIVRYAQREYDALDLETGAVVTLPVEDAPRLDPDVWKLSSLLAEGRYLKEVVGRPAPGERLVVTFREAVQRHFPLPFVPLLKELLKTLEALFGVAVDVEFALTAGPPGADDGGPAEGRFHVLQVRPLHARPDHEPVDLPVVPPERLLVTSADAMGNGVLSGLRHAVVVSAAAYAAHPTGVEAAREVGRLDAELGEQGYVLIGPGRWGTQNAALGVPVSFSEIGHARAIVEVSGGPFTPEFSYGTHFFGELAAAHTVYMAVFPDRGDVYAVDEWFARGRPTRHPAVRLVEVAEGLTCVVDGRQRRGMVFAGPPVVGRR